MNTKPLVGLAFVGLGVFLFFLPSSLHTFVVQYVTDMVVLWSGVGLCVLGTLILFFPRQMNKEWKQTTNESSEKKK